MSADISLSNFVRTLLSLVEGPAACADLIADTATLISAIGQRSDDSAFSIACAALCASATGTLTVDGTAAAADADAPGAGAIAGRSEGVSPSAMAFLTKSVSVAICWRSLYISVSTVETSEIAAVARSEALLVVLRGIAEAAFLGGLTLAALPRSPNGFTLVGKV
jgi:hypothetical protein